MLINQQRAPRIAICQRLSHCSINIMLHLCYIFSAAQRSCFSKWHFRTVTRPHDRIREHGVAGARQVHAVDTTRERRRRASHKAWKKTRRGEGTLFKPRTENWTEMQYCKKNSEQVNRRVNAEDEGCKVSIFQVFNNTLYMVICC